MAENREFIAANELPEIEAETVDVLCVNPETGEMGKKSGAALGGGSAGGSSGMFLFAKVYDAESMSVNPSTIVDITTDVAPTAQQIYDAFVSGGVRIYVQNEGGNPNWCTNILSIRLQTDSIKCYILCGFGTIANFDFPGNVVV